MEVSLAAETIFHLGPIPVTNSMIISWLVSGGLILFAYLVTKRVTLIPSKLQNFAEAIVEALYGLIEGIAGDRAKLFLPLLATFFLFVILGNWAGLLPGVGTIGFYEQHKTTQEVSHTPSDPAQTSHTIAPTTVSHPAPASDSYAPSTTSLHTTEVQKVDQAIEKEIHQEEKPVFVPFFRAATSDLNTTLALALISVAATQYFGIKKLGLKGYITHYFHSPLTGKAFIIAIGLLIGIFIGLLEVVSEFVKIISLSFRLFGNIYAGEAVLTTVSGLLAFLAPLPFMLLEVIVGFVQASVFMMLTLVFLAIITEGHGSEEHASTH